MEISSFSKLLFSSFKTENLIKEIKKSFIPPKSALRKPLFFNNYKNYLKANKFYQIAKFSPTNNENEEIISNKNNLDFLKYTNNKKKRSYSSVDKNKPENRIKTLKNENLKNNKNFMYAFVYNNLECDETISQASPKSFSERKIRDNNIKTCSNAKKKFLLNLLKQNCNKNQRNGSENEIKYFMSERKTENSKNNSNEKIKIRKYINKNFIDYLNKMDVGISSDRIININEKKLKNCKKRLILFRNQKYLYNNNNAIRDYNNIIIKKSDSNIFYSSSKIKNNSGRMLTLNDLK